MKCSRCGHEIVKRNGKWEDSFLNPVICRFVVMSGFDHKELHHIPDKESNIKELLTRLNRPENQCNT